MGSMLRFLALLALLLAAAAPARAQSDPFFTVDGLNEGLGAPPATVDRRTPRTAIDSFLSAAERGDWDAAAHLLDLRDVAPEDQSVEGPIRARQLHSVLDRKAIFDWGALAQRPDALQPLGSSQQAQAGEPRRSLLIRDLNLDPVPSAIRLNRVKPGEDADPVWVFPQETVADIPALYRAHGPSDLEARLPAPLRQDVIWGLMWWELLGLPLLIGAAALLGWLVKRGFDAARRASDRGIVRGVLAALRTPTIVIAVTALVSWATDSVFVFSGQIDTFLSPLIAIGYVTAALMLVISVADAILDNTVAPGEDVDLTEAEREEARATATKLNALKRILAILIFVIGAGVVLSTADVFRGLGLSLLASAGALTLVLGFAARNVLANVMASLQIALNQSARMGDRVVWKGELCHVERIHLTFVQLRNWDGTRVIAPVNEFVDETFTNWSLQEQAMLRILKFKVRPETDLDGLRDAFAGVLDALYDGELAEEMGARDEAAMNVTGQDVFGVDVWFSVPCADPNTSWEVACAAREMIVVAARDVSAGDGGSIFPEAQAAEAA